MIPRWKLAAEQSFRQARVNLRRARYWIAFLKALDGVNGQKKRRAIACDALFRALVTAQYWRDDAKYWWRQKTFV